MSRALLILNSAATRQKAALWCAKLPFGTRVEFKETKRTIPQNDRMWAMLTDVSVQARYHGFKLEPNDWKLLFLNDLKKELRVVPSLDGTGLVPLGNSSSDLSKGEMADLIELIFKYGAENSVTFNEPASIPSYEAA